MSAINERAKIISWRWTDNVVERDKLAADIVALVKAERQDAFEDAAKIAETAKTLRVWLPTGPNGTGESEHPTIHGAEIAFIIRAFAAKEASDD